MRPQSPRACFSSMPPLAWPAFSRVGLGRPTPASFQGEYIMSLRPPTAHHLLLDQPPPPSRTGLPHLPSSSRASSRWKWGSCLLLASSGCSPAGQASLPPPSHLPSGTTQPAFPGKAELPGLGQEGALLQRQPCLPAQPPRAGHQLQWAGVGWGSPQPSPAHSLSFFKEWSLMPSQYCLFTFSRPGELGKNRSSRQVLPS